MSEKVCLNGRMVGEDTAVVGVLDYGLLYGYGLFETMRAYSGVVFKLDEHLRRLVASAEILGMNLGGRKPELEESIYMTLKANERSDAYVRLTVTYGTGKPRIDLSGGSRPNYFTFTADIPDYREYYERGVRVIVSERVRQSGHSYTPRIKTLCYLDRVMAKKEAIGKGFFDALLLDEEGFVAEASTSNVFIVQGRGISTPRADSGILNGITRKTIMNLAVKGGFDVKEDNLSLNALVAADEAFMTNTIGEVIPVVQVGGSTVGNGVPGDTTRKLHELYKREVKKYVKEGK